MTNLYLVEQNSEARRVAMIDAALTDNSRFWLSRTLARLLIRLFQFRPVAGARRAAMRPAPTTPQL